MKMRPIDPPGPKRAEGGGNEPGYMPNFYGVMQGPGEGVPPGGPGHGPGPGHSHGQESSGCSTCSAGDEPNPLLSCGCFGGCGCVTTVGTCIDPLGATCP